jgi:epoxyqueuosine reductase
MSKIGQNVQREIEQFGYKAKVLSITRLPELQEAVGKLIMQGLLNKQLHERWHFYLQNNENLPEAKTIVVVAMPQPITRMQFDWHGIDYPADVAPNYFKKSDEFRAEWILSNTLEAAGYKVVRAHLALKTLAVRSGLARYGRNNISYISGMGSFCRLIAFYTDWPCEEDNWHESKAMEDCEDCSLCRENCPTGSISADRFLIHAENCLGFLNQMEPDFPYWVRLQSGWPYAFVGCMLCQFVCPVNKPYLDEIASGPSFSEKETGLILNKTPWEKLSSETKQKLDDLQEVYPLLGGNLNALIEKQRKVT